MTLQKILKLMEKKYPMNRKKGMNPVLFIYDDESGKILKNAVQDAYTANNKLFEFSTIQELVEHLQS